MSPRTTMIIGGVGRTLITMGCLTLAFAAFQLWGTGIAEDRAQNSLENDFTRRQAAFEQFAQDNGIDTGDVGRLPGTTVPGAVGTGTTVAPAPGSESTEASVESSEPQAPPVPAETIPPELLPKSGEALGVIRIPKLGVDKVVIAGTRRDDLRKGPGHYGTTPLPGQAGNAAIAGHRTTYGAPFGDLDLLEPGDRIVVETFQGLFNYEVIPQETSAGFSGHSIVTPFDVQVLDDYGDNRLTLTACHPKYSARQRIVVQAQLVNPPAATIAIAGLDDEVAQELSNQQLAYEATGVDPVTGEIDPNFDSGNVSSNGEGTAEPDSAQGRTDEGNVVGSEPEALDESLGWHFEELQPFLLWSLGTALAAALALVGARRWRRWPAYLLASPAVLTMLFFSFTHLDRMLPAF